MSGSFPFIPGQLPEHPRPLARFLPPVPDGPATAWLQKNIAPGNWILDPFGASPRLAVEAARAGYRVLAAANNPIERFLLELACRPPAESELRAALADLGAAQKAGERIEPHLLALYRSECAQCKLPVTVETFIWDRQDSVPSGKIYHCKNCNDSGERPATQADIDRADAYGSGGIHRLRALERVTPLDDPDRALAEEALDAYLPRAVYALITLVNKAENVPPERKRLLDALLLPVLDQANTLWSYPTLRARPRQISIPNRYREQNIWFALETAIRAYADISRNLMPIPISTWPELPGGEGGICLFKGPLRDLAEQTPADESPITQIRAALGAIPRPNQAYWTLSALWAGWLWGHEATAHFKSVLRRRRYDWAWHSSALHAAFKNLAQILPQGALFLGLIGESEPGYLASALVAAEMAGLDLTGVAIRGDQSQAQIMWQRAAEVSPPVSEETCRAAARQAIIDDLQARQEPADFAALHAAAFTRMAQAHTLVASALLAPHEVLAQAQEFVHAALAESAIFSRIRTDKSPESGQWRLKDSPDPSLGITDRVEMAVVRYLIDHPGCSLREVDNEICAAFPGLLTPDHDLIRECVESYGAPLQSGSDLWQLRPQDEPKARRADLERIRSMLLSLGSHLGFQAGEAENISAEGQPLRAPIIWRAASPTRPGFIFYCVASAIISNIVLHQADPAQEAPPARRVIVIPAGRARLIFHKLSHNPFLKQAVDAGWQIIKFRHVRRLSESSVLTAENLADQLILDPLANSDPQMALL